MKFVFDFRAAAGKDRAELGGKGFGLAEMTSLGLPVPPGFVITTAACREYFRTGSVPASLAHEVETALAGLEQARGLRLGDPERPLLLSVRSGAPVSMPGMMDTILNLGATATTATGLAELADESFALDSRRRFLESFGSVVLGVDQHEFDAVRSAVLGEDAGNPARLAELIRAFEKLLADHGKPVPEDPRSQLMTAIEAVFTSWHSPRARKYRELEGIPEDLGTAVTVQAMVFGNRAERSGTGVLFTRDPNTGHKSLYGDFLFNAQGEDVVSGRCHTEPLTVLPERLPQVWTELTTVVEDLERRRKDMLDIEFTVEEGQLFLLQVRAGKRASAAAVAIAVDLAEEGLISREEALSRIDAANVEQLTRPCLDPSEDRPRIATGLGAAPGVASGAVCLSADDVDDYFDQHDAVILVRPETSPHDLHGMAAADGIVTTRGGLVSHAAVVARDLGVPTVVGAADITVDAAAKCLRIGDRTVAAGEIITVDGTTGAVYLGAVETVPAGTTPALETLLGWADDISGMTTPHRTAVERLTAARQALRGTE